MARWCALHGAQVRVVDTRPAPAQLPTLRNECPEVEFVSGALQANALDMAGGGAELVLKSPGLSPAQVRELTQAADARAIPVWGELALFAQALHDLQEQQGYEPKVLAITGTNGKTTVTNLTTALVQATGTTVAMAGNVGPTMMDTLREAMQSQNLPAVWVLELSSFQLRDAGAFAPDAATVLNVTQDHLDWHEDMADYARCKMRVCGTGTTMVLNREDAAVQLYFDEYVQEHELANVRTVRFGYDAPAQAGDFGVVRVGGIDWLAFQPEATESAKSMMPVGALKIIGKHNACNALAALALCRAIDLPLSQLLYPLREYAGEPHRLQHCAVHGERVFIDDSKATNVGATISAISSLSASASDTKQLKTAPKLIVLLGGDGKGQDFAPLAQALAAHAKAVVLMGTDAPVIEQALERVPSQSVKVTHAANMEEAVAVAWKLSAAGDTVLLSPACASWDQYENYIQRGQRFAQAVEQLAMEPVQTVAIEATTERGAA